MSKLPFPIFFFFFFFPFFYFYFLPIYPFLPLSTLSLHLPFQFPSCMLVAGRLHAQIRPASPPLPIPFRFFTALNPSPPACMPRGASTAAALRACPRTSAPASSRTWRAHLRSASVAGHACLCPRVELLPRATWTSNAAAGDAAAGERRVRASLRRSLLQRSALRTAIGGKEASNVEEPM